ncbi:MAG: SDR family NAD(P)-dependent oxidoreductase, partial [Methyloligellaceae bacterium]
MKREQFSGSWRDRWHRRNWWPGPDRNRYNGLEPIVAITGGSQGIGCALAHEFVAAGHAVLLIARDPATLALATRDLTRSHADAVIFTHHVDLIDAGIRRDLEAHAAGLGYYVDVLVNAAGVGLAAPFITHSTRNVRDLVELN